jgi:hypothetical protein
MVGPLNTVGNLQQTGRALTDFLSSAFFLENHQLTVSNRHGGPVENRAEMYIAEVEYL